MRQWICFSKKNPFIDHDTKRAINKKEHIIKLCSQVVYAPQCSLFITQAFLGESQHCLNCPYHSLVIGFLSSHPGIGLKPNL